MGRFLAILAMTILAGCSVGVVAPQVMADCNNVDDHVTPDSVIQACSTAIATPNGLDSKNTAGALIDRANAYMRKKQFDLARGDYNAALQIRPSYKEAYVGRAYANFRLGDRQAALNDYSAALQLNPGDIKALSGRAHVYDNTGRYDLALADAQAALSINPGSSQAFLTRAFVYIDTDRFDLAIADTQTVLAKEPRNVDALDNDCLARGLGNKELQVALTNCNVALQIVVDDSNALYARGLLYIRLQKYADALSDMVAATRTCPCIAARLYLRGVAKSHLGDKSGAKADIDAALVIRPTIGKSLAEIGVTP